MTDLEKQLAASRNVKVTADTITDAQVRESGAPTPTIKVALNDATGIYLRASVVRDARARCAKLWNQRKR